MGEVYSIRWCKIYKNNLVYILRQFNENIPDPDWCLHDENVYLHWLNKNITYEESSE